MLLGLASYHLKGYGAKPVSGKTRLCCKKDLHALLWSCMSQVLIRLRRLQINEMFYSETFEKRSILFKAKEGENFNRRNTWSILRIKI
jgi:hypothetical protein